MKNKKRVVNKKIIIIFVISLILIGIADYFIFKNVTRNNFREGNPNFPPMNGNFNASDRRGNFSQNQTPPDEETKNQITSFFGNSPSSSEIEDYCSKNPSYCMYYCREINSDNDFCSQLVNNTQSPGDMPQQ